jgi:hypothetical protein
VTTAFATGCQGSIKNSPSGQKSREEEMGIRSCITSNNSKSKLLRLAQVGRVFSHSTAFRANELRISDQTLVLLKVFLNVTHILQKAEMLLMLGMRHFKPRDFNYVRHRKTPFANLCSNLYLLVILFKLSALDFCSFG